MSNQATNVTRTIRMLEAAGVAAAHSEDQSFPKRCGILAGKSVIGLEQAARKIRAAADARRSRLSRVATPGGWVSMR